jgi:hypothetical protein
MLTAPQPSAHVRRPVASVSYQVLAFVDTLADSLEVTGALAVLTALLASADITMAVWGLEAVLGCLIILLLIQVGASFFCAIDHFRLALLGATVSLSLALGVAAELSYVGGWWGWQILALSAAPVLLIALVLLPLVAITRRAQLAPAHRRFLFVNLLGPTLAVVAVAVWQALMSS